MLTKCAKSFLINAYVTPVFEQLDFYKNHYKKNQFEFLINEHLELLKCIQVSIPSKYNNYNYTENKIKNFNEIYNILFELNHVRINPKLNNYAILEILSIMLLNLGIKIENPPNHDSLEMCFKPLGEIKDRIRFYIKDNNQTIFLSNRAKPRLI